MDLDRHEWLARRVEEAVDPDRPIVDAHHHLWDRSASTYLADELLRDTTSTHHVVGTVFVECRSKYDRTAPAHLQPVGETAFVAAQAAAMRGRGTTLGAIVGFADLAHDALDEVLDAHEAAGDGLFRGIRHATAWSDDPVVGRAHTDPTEGLMGTNAFRRGAARLAERGMSFDAWLYHPQLDELVALARTLPELTIIADHLGAPLGVGRWAGRTAEVDEVWRASLTELASCPNVWMKIGGIGMAHYYGTDWASAAAPPSSEQVAAHWQDRVRWCIDTFGPDRCIAESNFPVDRQTLPYPVLWNSLQIMAAPYSDDEQDRLFHDNAVTAYRLDVA